MVTGVVPSPLDVPSFLSCLGFSIPTARRFSLNVGMLLTHALALSASIFFYARKNPYEYVHSGRIEPTKLVLIGTKITDQVSGDAGMRALNGRLVRRPLFAVLLFHLFGRNGPIYQVRSSFQCIAQKLVWLKHAQ